MTTLEQILNALKESGCFVGDIDVAIDEVKAKNERIKEFEEAQLTRREWYQKGYNEAMKLKTCKLCAYCEPFNSVCFNDKSPLCADFVNSEYGCIYWERKDNA